MSLTIEPIDLCWIADDDSSYDLCAHGGLRILFDQKVLLDDSSETWSLGPASLFLLRTLERDHVVPADDGPLFPCCAFAFYTDKAGRYVNGGGCPNDRDFDVLHTSNGVVLKLASRSITVTKEQWAQAVLLFCTKVRAFYEDSEPKEPTNEDAEGWRSFLREWNARYELASVLAGNAPNGSAG